jgi:hypothetical protein
LGSLKVESLGINLQRELYFRSLNTLNHGKRSLNKGKRWHLLRKESQSSEQEGKKK